MGNYRKENKLLRFDYSFWIIPKEISTFINFCLSSHFVHLFFDWIKNMTRIAKLIDPVSQSNCILALIHHPTTYLQCSSFYCFLPLHAAVTPPYCHVYIFFLNMQIRWNLPILCRNQNQILMWPKTWILIQPDVVEQSKYTCRHHTV